MLQLGREVEGSNVRYAPAMEYGANDEDEDEDGDGDGKGHSRRRPSKKKHGF
jgi:hypothetical protein